MKPYILSLGGSLIVPNIIDINYLKTFYSCITSHTKEGNRFIIITGGGKTARTYQAAAQAFHAIQAQGDLLGISATHMNALLLSTLFKEAITITDPTKTIPDKKIILAGGWKTGCSTDTVSTLIAKKARSRLIINLTNTDYVYNKDPRLGDAIALHDLTWKEYRKLIPKKWSPGLHAPFDPIAAKLAEKNKISVALIDGHKLDELDNIILGKKFKGTMIHP